MTLFKGRGIGGLTESELRRFKGLGPMFDFLRFHSLSCVRLFDDYMVDTLNADYLAITAGATATTFAHSANSNGMIRGALGTTAATSGLLAVTPAVWYGDYDCGMMIRFRVSDLDELTVEAGFVDAGHAAVDTLQVNSLTTPTFNGTIADVALWLYDDSSTTRTSGLYTDGTTVAAATKTAGSVSAPVADTWKTVGIQISGNYVAAFEGNLDAMKLVAQPSAAAIEGGSALKFFFDFLSGDTNDTNVDIDFIHVWQQRQ